jgi:hypothetical protein
LFGEAGAPAPQLTIGSAASIPARGDFPADPRQTGISCYRPLAAESGVGKELVARAIHQSTRDVSAGSATSIARRFLTT